MKYKLQTPVRQIHIVEIKINLSLALSETSPELSGFVHIVSPSNFNLLTGNPIRSIPALQIRHPTHLRPRHRARKIRHFIPVAHRVIKELDAAPVRDRVQSIRRGDGVQVGAAAGTSTSSVEFTCVIADFCGVQVEGPLDVSGEKREGGCGGGEEECGGRQGAESERGHIEVISGCDGGYDVK